MQTFASYCWINVYYPMSFKDCDMVHLQLKKPKGPTIRTLVNFKGKNSLYYVHFSPSIESLNKKIFIIRRFLVFCKE